MSSTIWVKVVGFSAVERHSINTLFRLSMRRTPSYSLWTLDAPAPPHVSLIDSDCHEAEVEMASPTFNANHKLIAVGSKPNDQAWRSFQRPVDWNVMVQVLDGLFASQPQPNVDTGPDEFSGTIVAPGMRVTLLVGMKPEERFYLRARLSLAGLTDVDEAATAELAGPFVSSRHYDVVIISLQLADADPWALVQAFNGMLSPPQAVIVATEKPSWLVMEHAEHSGCIGLLEIPFNPPQVLGLLQKV
ncbi:MAG: response regulator [Burkholderiales bacterium]